MIFAKQPYTALAGVFLSLAPLCTVAQPENWHPLDAKTSGYYGASVNQVYASRLLPSAADTVVVAIIDSGVDNDHEDLASNVWRNPSEIAANGVDDDGNGYVDDIFGWNYLAGPGGDIRYENLEITRQVRQLADEFRGKSVEDVQESRKEAYKRYNKLKAELDAERRQLDAQYQEVFQVASLYAMSLNYLQERLGSLKFTLADVEGMEVVTDEARTLRDFYVYAQKNQLEEAIEANQSYLDERLNFHYNTGYSERWKLGLDSLPPGVIPGTPEVEGPDADHGTHVAGIVAARRGNGIGIDGIADAVKVMVLRTVPNGDERDEDVAQAIRYAADHGAKIINMSFGKAISPQRQLVEEAVRYASGKGVLFVHGAGNDAQNIAERPSYPVKPLDNEVAWIEVGASAPEYEQFQVADFSNYGNKRVDIFAPGVEIYSLQPGSRYQRMSGTSMAAPVVAGVCALIWSRYPELNATQVREAVLSGSDNYGRLRVTHPQTGKEVKFKKLVDKGRFINAEKALSAADQLANAAQ